MATTNTNREPPVVKTAVEARDGVTGHNVRVVLAVGIILLVVIFGGIYLYYFGA